MELHDLDARKAKSYSNAIFNLERLDTKLKEMTEEEILKINGVGPSIAKAISEILETGTMTLLEELHDKTPPGIIQLLNIRGIGAGKIKTAWKELNIDSIETMLDAIKSGDLGKLKGFGAKTVQNLQASLQFYADNKNKATLPVGIEIGELIISDLQGKLKGLKIEPVGELRLKRPVIHRISFLATSEKPEEIKRLEFPFTRNEESSGPFVIRGELENIPVEVFVCNQSEFNRRIFTETGSEHHLSQLADQGLNILDLAEDFSEDSLYKGENEIPPVRREGIKELVTPSSELIQESDLKGILHCHSTYSDGRNTLREMAEGCRDLGYQYLGIADHSKSAFYYANGMYENRVRDQHAEIDALNKELAPFKIFKGIESDILPDGDLDYELNFLAEFDFVVASIHSVLNMDIQKATNRILRAIENPYTTILGHLTGRVLLQREGYPVDHKKIIDSCAENDVVIEINSHPSRLDLDWKWVDYAMEKGVILSINPDAHALDGYEDMKYGVWMGQKGGLTTNMTLNALSVGEIEEFFSKRKMKKTA